MTTVDDFKNALNTLGVSGFGVAMPVLSPSWTSVAATLPDVHDDAMALDLASGTNWHAPVGGFVNAISAADLPVTLISTTLGGERGAGGQSNAAGRPLHGPGVLLTMFGQAHARLRDLCVHFLEPNGAGLVRPVPKYFFFAGAVTASDTAGVILPDADLGRAGSMTVYDAQGFPLDPLFVAAVFDLLMTRLPALQHRASLSDAAVTATQVRQIAALATPSATRIWLTTPSGRPHDATHLEGVTAVAVSGTNVPGLFTLTTPSSGTAQVTREAVASGADAAAQAEREQLIFGPTTSGRAGNTFTPPALPTTSATTLGRDYFSLRVVQLAPYLVGTAARAAASAFNGTHEPLPDVRINETVHLLADGNDVLGAGQKAIDGADANAKYVVGQRIAGDFAAPAQSGSGAHWPHFPAPASTPPATSSVPPVSLRAQFLPTANFVVVATPAEQMDVILTLNGLPADCAVRVYSRKFSDQSVESRGDGAGGVAAAGSVTLRLHDPFDLAARNLLDLTPFTSSHPTMIFDAVVVQRSEAKEARSYGALSARVDPPSAAGAPPAETNLLGAATRRGVSNAGILGNPAPPLSLTGLPAGQVLATLAMALTGEPDPTSSGPTVRDASRLPTMGRREIVVAGHRTAGWSAVVSGGRLAAESHSADARRGAPGGHGGRETQLTGIATENGRLAHDIARMAARRTLNVVSRLVELNDARWNLPSAPAAPTATTLGTADGTFAGALLQTVSTSCETPELSLLRPIADASFAPGGTAIPATWSALVDWLATHLDGLSFTGAAELATQLRNHRDDLDPQASRLYGELYRELMASCYGRRDAQWSLADALANARRFVYIETPGFAPTSKTYASTAPAHPHALELMNVLRDRMIAAPALRAIICTPRTPDAGPGYEPVAAREAADRRQVLRTILPESQTVLFHPIGYPGRPSRIESTVIVIDDVWMLAGASAFRRRGLTFDGACDVVLTDTELVDGVSPRIATFRRALLADRLALTARQSGAFGDLATPSFARLRDGAEAFYVVRETLVAGGLGNIERLAVVDPPGTVNFELANPDGEEFIDDILGAPLLTSLAALNRH